MNENEIVFEVRQEPDGGFVAECLSEDIYTEAGSWDELRENVREAVSASRVGFTDPLMVFNRQSI